MSLSLCNFFLPNFALMQLENLHHFLNFHDNVQLKVIWHTKLVAVLVLSWRLAESDDTVTPSVMCMD
jgi:hypothetical protein